MDKESKRKAVYGWPVRIPRKQNLRPEVTFNELIKEDVSLCAFNAGAIYFVPGPDCVYFVFPSLESFDQFSDWLQKDLEEKNIGGFRVQVPSVRKLLP